jgi:hypothetical protein
MVMMRPVVVLLNDVDHRREGGRFAARRGPRHENKTGVAVAEVSNDLG